MSSGLEIERKFLVEGDDYKRLAFDKSHIQQGYICSGHGRTVRVRIRDKQAFLTIKGPSLNGGLSRYEFEQGRADTLFTLLLWALRTALPWLKGWMDDLKPESVDIELQAPAEGNTTRCEGHLVQDIRWRIKLSDGRLTEPIAHNQVKKYFHNGQNVTADITELDNGRIVARSICKVKTTPQQLEKRGLK